MDLHEYQAKQLLQSYRIGVPAGGVAATADEAEAVARTLPGPRWAVKAQIHAGARGPAGGVKIVESVEQVRDIAELMLGSTLTTAQTGPEGQQIRRVYIEEGCEIARGFYLALLVDVTSARLLMLLSPEQSAEGIEAIAVASPEQVIRLGIDIDAGLTRPQTLELAAAVDLSGDQAQRFADCLTTLYGLYTELDASLIELSPLVITDDDRLLALDAKMSFDDNALFRHPTVKALRVRESANPLELAAAQQGLNYVRLGGDVGLMVSGAGLALATLDAVVEHGGRPANFLDVPPIARQQQIAGAFRLLQTDPQLAVILVNVFGGGIMRCDAVADGIIAAVREQPLRVPLVVRLAGINADLGIKALRDAGIAAQFSDDLASAAAAAATLSRPSDDGVGGGAAAPAAAPAGLLASLKTWFGQR